MDKIQNPHDKLFRETWSDKTQVLDFLKNFLPKPILKLIDLETLEICKDSFVKKALRESFSDMLYKISFMDKPAYLYLLFEHKSYPDKWVHIQILEYMCDIWRLDLKQNENAGHLPIIIPMLITHTESADGWTCSTHFSDLFEAFPEALKPYFPDFDYILFDLNNTPDEVLQGRLLYRASLMLMKYARSPELQHKLPDILGLIKDLLTAKGGTHYLEIIFRYLFSAAEGVSAKKFRAIVNEALSPKEGDMLMTLAEQLIRQGEIKGKIEGKIEGLTDGLFQAIELGTSLKFGEEGLRIMAAIQKIKDPERLADIKDAIKTVKDISELEALIDN